MTNITFISQAARQGLKLSAFILLGLVLIGCHTSSRRSAKIPGVPKWTRHELTFKSSVNYPNPLQACTLTAVFTSPQGETNLVYGFWDGGKTWRVRFSPNQAGRWTYRTSCSDPANRDLQNQRGAFLCTAPIGNTRFNQHGPIRLARDGRHFEHEDGTPFFWLADSAWNGARLSKPTEWTTYAETRAYQKFSASQWSVAPGKDFKGEVAFHGMKEIVPNPEFFQRLDAKVETLNRAGLLSIIAPLWKVDRQSVESLSEGQLILLMRYVVARWGSDQVAWLLACDGSNPADMALWKRVGRSAFAEPRRDPVILFADESVSGWNQFRDEPWFDAYGYGSGGQDFWRQHLPTAEAKEKATLDRPTINVEPPSENSAVEESEKRISADAVRRTLWDSVLESPAGVSYATEAVANWSPIHNPNYRPDLALWQKSLFLSGAKQATLLSTFFNSFPFWELHPAPHLFATQPESERGPYVAAAQTDDRQMSVFYVPDERMLELSRTALPASPILTWINPRTGETRPGVAAVGPRSVKIPTPAAGDWVLVVKSRK